jgi:hypothetical protein
MGIINMTSLIFFGTIIILLGIIIVCFYNKSFEINEGFRYIDKQKAYYTDRGAKIKYNANDIKGYEIVYDPWAKKWWWVLYKKTR